MPPDPQQQGATQRLFDWSRDALHFVQSVRMHEPTYRNPAELRADVRTLLLRLADAESALRYIQQEYGRLDGVGWERVL